MLARAARRPLLKLIFVPAGCIFPAVFSWWHLAARRPGGGTRIEE
jgi:hypothetical protein